MAKIERIQQFVREYQEASQLPIDPVMLLAAWDRQYSDLKEFVRGVHDDLVASDQESLREHYNGGQETYYLDAVGQYATDQDDTSLRKVTDLLQQNILESYVLDKYFWQICAEVIKEEIKPAVIPDIEP